MNLVETSKTQDNKAAPRVALVTLFFTLLAMAMSFSFVFAVLPPIGRDLGLSELQLALVVAPAALVFVIANGVWGVLSERVGRKLVILIAVAGYHVFWGGYVAYFCDPDEHVWEIAYNPQFPFDDRGQIMLPQYHATSLPTSQAQP